MYYRRGVEAPDWNQCNHIKHSPESGDALFVVGGNPQRMFNFVGMGFPPPAIIRRRVPGYDCFLCECIIVGFHPRL